MSESLAKPSIRLDADLPQRSSTGALLRASDLGRAAAPALGLLRSRQDADAAEVLS